MEENQYYTPSITDIRVGYEFEHSEGAVIGTDGALVDNWEKCVVAEIDHLRFYKNSLEEGKIRIKYITIEDIVAEGWNYEEELIPVEGVVVQKPISLHKFRRGRYFIIYDFVARVIMIALNYGDIFSVCVQRYNCPSVNELRYIISSLNLQT